MPQRSTRSARMAVAEGGCRWRRLSPAAIDADRLAGDKTGLVGGEIGDHRGDLVGAAEAADRDRLGALAEAGFEIVAVFAAVCADRARGADRPGADGIDRNAIGREIQCL